MTIGENADVFFNQPVKDFTGPEDWEGPKTAYRLRITWDDSAEEFLKRLDQLAKHPKAGQLQALVIGAWSGDDSSKSSQDIIEALCANHQKFAGLKALFLGDITFEENEISWIEQSDVSPLLKAYPQLEVLRVRGGNSLKFTKIKHVALRQLIIETGGLRRSVLREVSRCEFPNLEHLELWLGVENYGFDGGIEDLQTILAGKRFPQLKYLGLCNSDIADEIAPVVVNAPVLQQLEILDLSNGTLSDVGGQALLQLPVGLPLKVLDLTHHYLTEGMVTRLKKALSCKVVVAEPQDPENEWRSVVVSE